MVITFMVLGNNTWLTYYFINRRLFPGQEIIVLTKHKQIKFEIKTTILAKKKFSSVLNIYIVGVS